MKGCLPAHSQGGWSMPREGRPSQAQSSTAGMQCLSVVLWRFLQGASVRLHCACSRLMLGLTAHPGQPPCCGRIIPVDRAAPHLTYTSSFMDLWSPFGNVLYLPSLHVCRVIVLSLFCGHPVKCSVLGENACFPHGK